MKRIIKIILLSSVLCFVISISVGAFDGNIDSYLEEFETENVFSSLDSATLNILEEIGITEISYQSIFSLSPQKVFNALFNIVSSAIKEPVRYGIIIVGILLITSLATSFISKSEAVTIIGGGALSLCIAVPVSSSVSTAFSVLQSLLAFTTGFSGVFCGIVSASGNIALATSHGALTVFLNNILSFFLVEFSRPVVNAMCSMGFLSCFDVYLYTGRFVSILKKVYVFFLSLCGTIFSGLVTLKGVLSEGVDSLSSRSIRFVIGQSLPIVGGAVSETYSTLISSLSLIKNTVGVFGIITVVVFVLPTLIELLLWLLTLEITLSVSQATGTANVGCLLDIFKNCLVILIATIVMVATVFIISVGVCIAVKGGIS